MVNILIHTDNPKLLSVSAFSREVHRDCRCRGYQYVHYASSECNDLTKGVVKAKFERGIPKNAVYCTFLLVYTLSSVTGSVI